jgi:hypothetical protein
MIRTISFILLIALLCTACRRDADPPPTPPPPASQEELITTVILTFVDTEPNDLGIHEIFYLEWRDVDGVGGEEPFITADAIPAFRNYTVSLTFRDESVSPPRELTEEIHATGEEHQVFFIPSNTSLVITYADEDAQGAPIGLINTAYTGAAGKQGSLTVILRHGPNKSGEGVAQGDIANAGGETDVEATFPIAIF